MKDFERNRRKKLLEKILNYYEGHKETLGIYPELTACELKAELSLEYKDIRFLLNG